MEISSIDKAYRFEREEFGLNPKSPSNNIKERQNRKLFAALEVKHSTPKAVDNAVKCDISLLK